MWAARSSDLIWTGSKFCSSWVMQDMWALNTSGCMQCGWVTECRGGLASPFDCVSGISGEGPRGEVRCHRSRKGKGSGSFNRFSTKGSWKSSRESANVRTDPGWPWRCCLSACRIAPAKISQPCLPGLSMRCRPLSRTSILSDGLNEEPSWA